MELRWLIWRAMYRSKYVIEDVDKGYNKILGRNYSHGLVERYRVEDAKYLIVSMGSWSGDAKDAVDMLRDEGYEVGLARIRYVRPFPSEIIRDISSDVKAVLVIDRAVSMGSGGILYSDILRSIDRRTPVKNVIAGIGGVDVNQDHFKMIIEEFIDEFEKDEYHNWNDTYWFMPWMR